MPKINNSARGNGRTTQQMLSAKHNALYVWCNSRLDYPKLLASYLEREDLEIVSPLYLESTRWRGRRFTQVVIDHAAQLTREQRGNLAIIAQNVEERSGKNT
jgi:hypothetical protein